VNIDQTTHAAGAWSDESGNRRAVELPAQDEDTTVRIATDRLKEDFDEVPRAQIESTVRRRLRELCARSHVRTFVGVIAERQARTELADRVKRTKR